MAQESDIRENLEVFAGRCPPSTIVMEDVEDDFVFSVDSSVAKVS